jgi:hypothetical protein
MKYDGYMRSINQGSCWFKIDPFILATQATKVFYLDDTKHGGSWKVVQKFQHRQLWSVVEHERDTDIQLSYQDDECIGCEVQLSEQNLDFDLDSGVSPLTVEATIVDQLRRQRDMEEELEGNDSSDSEDETEWQYASDCDEGSAIRENQDDEEDSDGD